METLSYNQLPSRKEYTAVIPLIESRLNYQTRKGGVDPRELQRIQQTLEVSIQGVITYTAQLNFIINQINLVDQSSLFILDKFSNIHALLGTYLQTIGVITKHYNNLIGLQMFESLPLSNNYVYNSDCYLRWNDIYWNTNLELVENYFTAQARNVLEYLETLSHWIWAIKNQTDEQRLQNYEKFLAIKGKYLRTQLTVRGLIHTWKSSKETSLNRVDITNNVVNFSRNYNSA